MTEYEILQYIKDVKDENGNAVFTPSNDTKLFKVDGQNIVMPCSFYRKVIVDGEEYFENFKVRAANHGGWFSRWEEDKELKPWLNKQNIDIVFAPFSATHSNLKANTFFVIQQYVYDSNEITIKKLKRIINAVLNIGKNDFSDPLGTARYRVLRPTNDKDELIPVPTDKSVNEYQIKVLREYEESENRHGTNESSICRVQFDNIIYKTNMTHIKRLDEMAKSTVGTKRDRRITESRASRKGFKQLNESSFSDAFSGKGTKDIEVRIREMMLLFEGYVSGYGNKIVVDGLNNEFIENKFQCDDYDIVTMSDTSEVWVLFNHNHLIPEEKMFHELDKETQRIVYDDFIDYMNRNFLDNMRLKYNQL
ncbi:MAG: hypothetical protein J6W06_12415 [Bacteroidales bacterium]|nr:hypothetical protein [Bacteroidales bacterium]